VAIGATSRAVERAVSEVVACVAAAEPVAVAGADEVVVETSAFGAGAAEQAARTSALIDVADTTGIRMAAKTARQTREIP
jgi:hypothetical protein